MIRSVFVPVLLGFFYLAEAQEVQILREVQTDNSIKVFAKNESDIEQSVMLQVESTGLKASEDFPITRVIQPRSSEYFVTLTPEKGGYSMKYKYSYVRGDVTGKHDDDHIYQLPFKKGETYNVGQSYNETPTHMDKYAVDFDMPEGTEICAIRDGVVIDLEEGNNKGCPKEDCMKYNNFVLIKHKDGSLAEYSHIRKKGTLVKIGDEVKAGQPIALSGATGWASGPHLHLEVYLPTFTGNESLKVRYQLDENTVGIPQSRKKYQREL